MVANYLVMTNLLQLKDTIWALILPTSDKITGYLGSVLAVDVVAEWAILPQGGKQVGGVGIHNVSNDYFYADKNYKYTKKIISSLNPSVK